MGTRVPGSLQKSSRHTNMLMVKQNPDTLVPGSLQKSSRHTMLNQNPSSSKPTSFRARNSNRSHPLLSLLVICLMSIQTVHGMQQKKVQDCPLEVGDTVISKTNGWI